MPCLQGTERALGRVGSLQGTPYPLPRIATLHGATSVLFCSLLYFPFGGPSPHLSSIRVGTSSIWLQRLTQGPAHSRHSTSNQWLIASESIDKPGSCPVHTFHFHAQGVLSRLFHSGALEGSGQRGTTKPLWGTDPPSSTVKKRQGFSPEWKMCQNSACS